VEILKLLGSINQTPLTLYITPCSIFWQPANLQPETINTG